MTAAAWGQPPATPVQAPVQPPASSEQAAAAREAAGLEVFERWIEAQGGREAIQAVTSRTVRGTISLPEAGVSGTVVMYQAAGGKVRIEIKIEGVLDQVQASDGTRVWVASAGATPVLMEGLEREQFIRTSVWGAELQEGVWARIEAEGEEKVGEARAIKVRHTAPSGDFEVRWYDVETGRLLKAEAMIAMGPEQVRAELEFEDYRTSEGLTEAFKTTTRLLGQSQVVAFTSVTRGEPLDPALFAAPKDLPGAPADAPEKSPPKGS